MSRARGFPVSRCPCPFAHEVMVIVRCDDGGGGALPSWKSQMPIGGGDGASVLASWSARVDLQLDPAGRSGIQHPFLHGGGDHAPQRIRLAAWGHA